MTRFLLMEHGGISVSLCSQITIVPQEIGVQRCFAK